METPNHSVIVEPTTPESSRNIGAALIPLFTTAGLLMSGAQPYSPGIYEGMTYQTSDHVLTLSQSELSEIQKPKLPYRVTLPQISNGENNINSGFNTQHLGFDSESIGYATLPEFKKQIDFISENHQTDVRFGIPRWEVASLTPDKKDIVWNQKELDYFKEASIYAQSQGLNIYFVTTPPEVPDGFNLDSYLAITKKYYNKIANEFTGVTYQLGNEYDAHNVLNYGHYDQEITGEQLQTYQKWLEVATDSIREVNPSAQITQSLTGYPMNSETIKKWEKVHEYIGKYITSYSLDTYPTSVENAKELPILVNEFRNWVKQRNRDNDKDIGFLVAEVGIPTLEGVYTEEQQRQIVPVAILAYKEAGIKVLPYQLKDESSQKKEKSFLERIEERFGIFRSDGSKKPAADPIMDALKTENP